MSGAWRSALTRVFALIRLNREYRTKAGSRPSASAGRHPAGSSVSLNYSRRVVIVFVDDFDLFYVAGAAVCAKSLRPTVVRAVHFVIDTAKAEQLRIAWGCLIAAPGR